MINVKLSGKRFKIYANGQIKCLDEYLEIEMDRLKDIVTTIDNSYGGPSDGFPVSRMAGLLPDYGVEVLNYRDYEMENAEPSTIY